MGVQGQDFKADLLGPNSKPSKGLRKANLSPRTKALLEEVALSEQVLPRQSCIHHGNLLCETPITDCAYNVSGQKTFTYIFV